MLCLLLGSTRLRLGDCYLAASTLLGLLRYVRLADALIVGRLRFGLAWQVGGEQAASCAGVVSGEPPVYVVQQQEFLVCVVSFEPTTLIDVLLCFRIRPQPLDPEKHAVLLLYVNRF